MAIDSGSEVDQTTSSTSTQSADNASAGSVSTDTQASEQPAGASADAGSAVADNPTEIGSQASLTTDSETKTTVAPSAPATQDWQKQYKEIQGWSTRVHQTNLDLQKQLKELQSKRRPLSHRSIRGKRAMPSTRSLCAWSIRPKPTKS